MVEIASAMLRARGVMLPMGSAMASPPCSAAAASPVKVRHKLHHQGAVKGWLRAFIPEMDGSFNSQQPHCGWRRGAIRLWCRCGPPETAMSAG